MPDTQEQETSPVPSRRALTNLLEQSLLDAVESAADHPDAFFLLHDYAAVFTKAAEACRGAAWARTVDAARGRLDTQETV